MIPYYVFIIILFTVYEITGLAEVSLFQWLFCLFNLQGLNYTYWKFEAYGAVAGIGPLWFITTIMLCYLLTPIANKFRNIRIKKGWILLLVVLVFVGQAGAMYCGFQLHYLIVYFLGYFTGANKVRTDKKYYLIISALMIIITGLRFYLRSVIDGTDFYDLYFALISAGIIGVWIFYTVYFIKDRFPYIFDKTAGKFLTFMEMISYYVYITHYLWIKSPFAPSRYLHNKILSNFLAVVGIFILAVALWALTEKIIIKSLFSRKTKKEKENENSVIGNG
ncbi:MAG: hypothetical protein IJX91_02865 [Clostridia bacterium]|nr:hypothetical protein [Clostridia bacterium]